MRYISADFPPQMGVLAILLYFHVTIAFGGLVSDPCASLRAQNVQLLDQLSARDAELSRLRSELAAVRSVKEGKERPSPIGTGAERALGNAAVPLSHRRRAETDEGCLSPPSHALPSLRVRAHTQHARCKPRRWAACITSPSLQSLARVCRRRGFDRHRLVAVELQGKLHQSH